MPTAIDVRDPFDLIGTTIEGKYRVAQVIGDGGFGVVYRGVHTGFGELIAIKCLKIPESLDDKHRQELLEQLRDEGRLLHKLSKATPGIVQALDVGAMTTPRGAWVPYLVLEWLDGETLAELQRKREEEGKGGMPVAEAVELLTPAARALAVAHQHKIAHRDVKPANLFVTHVSDRRTVKVLDFGIAKVLTDTTMTEALAVTRQGPSAFTPRYGAPEQFNKQRGASGPWTDVFALGLILVELCTGKRALDGDDPTQLYVASADPTLRPTLRGRGLDVSDAVENVISKALHVEPKYRYPDAGELWDALTAAVGLPPDVRSSQPSVSSGRGKSAEVAKQPIAGGANLATAEFAVQADLAVHSDGPRSGPPEPHAVTRPAESALGNELPHVIVSSKPEGQSANPPSVTSASEQVVQAANEPSAAPPKASASKSGKIPENDPMAETPFYARAIHGDPGKPKEQNTGSSKSTGDPTAPKADATKLSAVGPPYKAPESREIPVSAPASSVEPKSGKGILWALLGIGAAAGVTGYLYFTRPGIKPDNVGPKGSASGISSTKPTTGPKPNVSGSPSASAVPSASASVTASASASGAAPPAPPEDMVYIAPLTAMLGEGPTSRSVTLTKGFYLEKKEVSAAAYHACVGSGYCQTAAEVKSVQRFTQPADADAGADAGVPEEVKQYEDVMRGRCTESRGQGDLPINCITYSNAEQYCRWKKRRLPTEAEWEAAAQGTEARAYPWGTARPDCEAACVDKNAECRSGDVAPCSLGSHGRDKTPTEISDMAGNVAEWVADGFAPKPISGTDPRANPFAKTRVVRGGDFFHSIDHVRASFRREIPSGAAETWIGVRCAMDIPATP
ncbi:MAG: SUMF1/EgtB/PvdO family nonheme iron enzyme [Polyangiaceae bacterium]|nr:SUMF1/EgtB/PvdO family nonheme iron enzyme [Polyangiaceae bacterium]